LKRKGQGPQPVLNPRTLTGSNTDKRMKSSNVDIRNSTLLLQDDPFASELKNYTPNK